MTTASFRGVGLIEHIDLLVIKGKKDAKTVKDYRDITATLTSVFGPGRTLDKIDSTPRVTMFARKIYPYRGQNAISSSALENCSCDQAASRSASA